MLTIDDLYTQDAMPQWSDISFTESEVNFHGKFHSISYFKYNKVDSVIIDRIHLKKGGKLLNSVYGNKHPGKPQEVISSEGNLVIISCPVSVTTISSSIRAEPVPSSEAHHVSIAKVIPFLNSNG